MPTWAGDTLPSQRVPKRSIIGQTSVLASRLSADITLTATPARDDTTSQDYAVRDKLQNTTSTLDWEWSGIDICNISESRHVAEECIETETGDTTMNKKLSEHVMIIY